MTWPLSARQERAWPARAWPARVRVIAADDPQIKLVNRGQEYVM
jgi:hypothetical protein